MYYFLNLKINNPWKFPICENQIITINIDDSNIEFRCFDINDKFIFIGCKNKIIMIYNRKNGEICKKLNAHEGGVLALKTSKDFLITSGTDFTIKYII